MENVEKLEKEIAIKKLKSMKIKGRVLKNDGLREISNRARDTFCDFIRDLEIFSHKVDKMHRDFDL